MTKSLTDFQRYQLEFAASLRNPGQSAPAGVSDKHMAIYRDLVFNNLSSSVSACFPIAEKMAGKRLWKKLLLAFLQHYSADQPLFRKIPAQFVEFLQSHALPAEINLPPYLPQLCHYEWIELHVSSLPCSIKTDQNTIDVTSPTAHKLSLNPTLQILHYDYPVHKISIRNQPQQTEPTWLLVFRNQDDAVKFIETNALTCELMTLIKEQQLTGRQALERIAARLPQSSTDSVMAFGEQLLADLAIQGIITLQ